jgi:hypothetical protein
MTRQIVVDIFQSVGIICLAVALIMHLKFGRHK